VPQPELCSPLQLEGRARNRRLVRPLCDSQLTVAAADFSRVAHTNSLHSCNDDVLNESPCVLCMPKTVCWCYQVA
jgi:hypothetical protein